MPAAGTFYGVPAGITGSFYGGDPLGERGADVAVAGPEGPSLLGLDVQLPAEAEDLFRAVVLSIPAGLTLFQVDKYSRVTAEGPDGLYVGSKQGYRFNVPYGTPQAFTIVIGAGASGTVTLNGPTVSGGGSVMPPSGLSGGITLDDPTVTGGVSSGVLPARITLQPQPATVPAGRPATFRVEYEGLATVALQWLRDGQAIEGEISDTFRLSPAQLADSGAIFSVTASNAIGNDTSQGAELTVLEALDMYTLRAPKDQINYVGGFGPKDPAAVLWLVFDFKRYTSAPTNPVVTITRLGGADDANPDAMKSGQATASGTLVFQKVIGGVHLCDYQVRCDVDGPDGTKPPPMVGLLPVRRTDGLN